METGRWALLVAVAALLVLAGPGCRRCTDLRPVTRSSADSRPAPKKEPPPPPPPPEIIDSHTHITPLNETMFMALQIFKKVGVTKFAVKSAGTPGTLRYEETKRFAEMLGERMAFFTNIEWEGIDEPGWAAREAEGIARAMAEGASGIKIFKGLGLGVRLKNDKLLRIDDKRLEPIWRKAEEVGAIVAWHVADPVAFFKPVDKNNERYEELSAAPEWSFHGKDFPGHDELLAQRDKVVKAHPKVTFLGIHLANYPENLDYVDSLLDSCPNMFVDVSARLGEIGRHPREKVREFFIKHQDRILFGTDFIITPNGMQLGSLSEKEPTVQDAIKFYEDHRRFFETADRRIEHPTPIQGRWTIDAIDLPEPVLAKVYRGNAERLIFSKRRAWLQSHRQRRATER